MAEPRKVQFVTLSAFAGGPGAESRKHRLEDETDMNFGRGARMGASVTGAAGGRGLFDKTVKKRTVRLSLSLPEPSDKSSSEFNYGELLRSQQAQTSPRAVAPALEPTDPSSDDERETPEAEALSKKFDSKYGTASRRKRRDRVQDLIDIGFGYDESDPFIDNSEAYDELVPASLTTKLGGFYINTGTLQFRAASESEGEDVDKDKHTGEGEDQDLKKKRKDGASLEVKKPRKNRLPKQGTLGLNIHRPEKKRRRKPMKDSLCLAAMLRRFTREKEEMHKHGLAAASNSLHPQLHHIHTTNNDTLLADLAADPAMMSLLTSANENELQDLLSDLDFSVLDTGPQPPAVARENGQLASGVGPKVGGGALSRGQVGLLSPPPLPDGLPAPLVKRIEDLRSASRQFDQEGRKKFFTLDMNNILLDIELQVQEQPLSVRADVYSHLEAFVPCNKEALLKRLKKLSLNIQDDRLRTPLLKLKLAVCSVMPEQTARYNMDCMAKVAANRQQMEEGERNGSEEEEEERTGKRVIGPRKKFIWDDKLRNLLCNLVRVKLKCFEQEQCSLSVEDYLKAFLENEVKPLWPKGWMQARMLFKESRTVHGHLTGLGKKRIVPTPKPTKVKEVGWTQRASLALDPASASPALLTPVRPPPSPPSEPICLSDSLDEDLATNSLDSIAHALSLLNKAANGVNLSSAHTSSSPPRALSSSSTGVGHYSSPLPHTESPALSLSTSPVTSCPLSSTSPALSGRMETFSGLKDIGCLQRRPVTSGGRSSVSNMNATPPAKPRPPPTASPLLPPQQRAFGVMGMKPGHSTPPTGQLKNSGSKSADGCSGMAAVSQTSRVNSHLNCLNSRSPQQPSRVPSSPSQSPTTPSPSPLLPQSKAPPLAHPQPGFITPMQATLTKSSHSSSSPIIKLTHRPPAPTPPPVSSPSPSPSLSLAHSRSQILTQPLQYSPKSPGFRPPFSVPAPSSAVKPSAGQLSYSFAGGQKSISPLGSSAGITNPSSIATSHTTGFHDNNTSPSAVSTNHGHRQKPVGGASQSAKTSASRVSAMGLPPPSDSSLLSQVTSAAGGSLLGSVGASLPLGFGMLGGLVPVSLPFQFPPLLNFAPPGPATPTPGCSTGGASPASNSGYGLTQNLFKSLQSGVQAALPPHLQLAFSDTNQSQADVKRKSH
ncbi:ubinuclein-2a isoform X1 [Electrophorus electricus]|uniref:ubinuclein-2a isoform X1 n=1 Tax=Electrophorus electricus TaxID=8005 RepID=UPI0015D05E2F|nr:ubinuclein-2a isoform X1 [Electrophorus electricus]